MDMLHVYYSPTKIGKMLMGESNKKIVYIGFPGKEMIKKLSRFSQKNDFVIKLENSETIKRAFIEIKQYLEGKRKKFSFPVKLIGTEMQVKIWKATYNIPFGKVSSYSEIAKKIGGGKYARVVGNAMAENPIPIVVPCHRVIGKDGGLKGFGGGLELKRYLLELERENTTL